MAMTNTAAVRAPATERARGMSRLRPPAFRDWSVRAKLAAVLLIPAIAALSVGVFRVTDLLSRAGDFGTDAVVSEAQESAADLAAEIGREQVVVVADVSGATATATTLPPRQEQQAATDAAATRTLELVGEVEAAGDLERRTRALQNALDQLTQIRQATAGDTAGGLQPAQVARAYHQVSGSALALGDALVSSVTDDELQSLAQASQSLTATNRQVALEDSFVLAIAAVGPDALDPAELRGAVTDRADAFAGFQARATAEQQARYSSAFMNDEGQARSARFAEVLRTVTAGGDPGVAPEEWTAVAVPSAAAGEAVRQELSAEQVSQALSLRDDTRAQAVQETIVVLLLLALGLAVTLLAAASILRPLRRLRADAITIAEERLPQAIQRIREAGPDSDIQVQPVDIRSREEIGQVARAFDAVHVEAIRLAAEQEQLRRNVNELFVNLSRRSQALVERQLALIDRLENDEQDPDQLSQLFRLDHLAARMRRNNDNLMVLAGSDASRGGGRALRVVDVVRAAVSETEQYERVTVRATPGVTVAAATSHDLVHLLAELLDNATVFSAPDTSVTVDVEGSSADGMRIEVADQGLGIPHNDLDEFNSKLAEPPVVDAGVPRQMGLFVVAHLARRHGIRVWLRPGAGGRGTVAVVEVPPAVLAGGGDVMTGSATASVQARPVNGSSARPTPSFATALPAADTGPISRPSVPSPAVAPEPRTPAPLFSSASPAVPERPAAAPVPDLPVVAAPPDPPAVTVAAEGPDDDPLTGPIERVTVHSDGATQWDGSVEEETPIFRELSAWFRTSTPATAVRTPEPVNGVSHDGHQTSAADGANGAGQAATVHRIPTSPVAPQPAVASAAFASAADEGWIAAAAAGAEQPAELTASGLPRRRPMAQLVPGSAPSASAAPTVRNRDADAVRGRLANYQRGLQTGRTRIRPLTDDEGAPTTDDTHVEQDDQRRYAP